MSSRRRPQQHTRVVVLDDVDWQDKRVRVGISSLLVVAAVAVMAANLDGSGNAGSLSAAVEPAMTVVPTLLSAPVTVTAIAPPVTSPVAVTSTEPAGVAPTTLAVVPQALAATTAFVPTTARPTSPPPTQVSIEIGAAATCSVTSAVRPGSSGDDVRCVQHRLREIMAIDLGADADGRFGPGTETAVRLFQQASGLSVNGVVGASTARRLGIWQEATAP